MTWSEQIRQARGDLTQADAARLISPHLSVRTLQEWESGRRTPPEWVQELVLSWMRRLPIKKPLP